MSLGYSHKRRIHSVDLQDIKWEDAICPICLESPHNCVLLYCSSYDKGCRPFMCDTNHTHSNCLGRFRAAHGLPASTSRASSSSSSSNGASSLRIQSISSNADNYPACPLCRGIVTGWLVIDEARICHDSKKRCCEERDCSYSGNYSELQVHVKECHPDACPAEVDPLRRRDWENFQESAEIDDVLSTVHSEIPNGVVLGDYVIEYGDESGDEYEDFPGDDGNWWTSCLLYQVFDNFRASRRRRRTRSSEAMSAQQRSVYDDSRRDGGSVSPQGFGGYQFHDSDDEFVVTSGGSSSSLGLRDSSSHRSYRRRRSQFLDPQ